MQNECKPEGLTADDFDRLAPDGTKVVYFIGWHGVDVKIGYSAHLRERLCPQKILAVAFGDRTLERQYHARFASDRTRGEWFNWSPEIEAEINRLSTALTTNRTGGDNG